jgi:hypothetical protein
MNKPVIILRAMLIAVALEGVFCSIALLQPWASMVAQLKWFGIEGVPAIIADPIIEYWLLQTAALSCIVGFCLFVMALSPQKYKPILPAIGWSLIFIGVTSAYHGFRLGLPPWPFYADMVTCGICGPGIVWLARRI